MGAQTKNTGPIPLLRLLSLQLSSFRSFPLRILGLPKLLIGISQRSVHLSRLWIDFRGMNQLRQRRIRMPHL